MVRFPHFGASTVSNSSARYQAGSVTLKATIIKGGVEKFALKQPIFLPSPIDPVYSAQVCCSFISLLDWRGFAVANDGLLGNQIVFEGISVNYRES